MKVFKKNQFFSGFFSHCQSNWTCNQKKIHRCSNKREVLSHNSYVSMASSKNRNFVYLSSSKDYQRQYPAELRARYIVSKELGKVSEDVCRLTSTLFHGICTLTCRYEHWHITFAKSCVNYVCSHECSLNERSILHRCLFLWACSNVRGAKVRFGEWSVKMKVREWVREENQRRKKGEGGEGAQSGRDRKRNKKRRKSKHFIRRSDLRLRF